MDAHYKHSLAVVRALAREGVEVHVGSTFRHALCFYSRFVRKRFLYPDPTKRQMFLHALEGIDRQENYDVLLPIGNETWYSAVTVATGKIRKKMPLPPTDSYLTACNKAKTLAFASKLGIPIPKTAFLRSSGRIASGMRFPVVVKPALGSGNARVFYRHEDAETYLRSNRYSASEFVAQERLRGDGYGFFALYNRGRLRNFCMHRRVREVPPTGGVSSAAESVYEPKLLELGSRLLNRLSWHGVAMVEFKRDTETDEFRLLEVNPKFWGSLDLAIACGVNFPYLAACLITAQEASVPASYKSLRYCWFPDDLYHVTERPSSLASALRDWVDPRVRRNVWLSDLGPHLLTLALISRASAKWHFLRVYESWFPTKPMRFSWVVPGKLAASGGPRSAMQLRWLYNHGIRAVLDLTETPSPLKNSWRLMGAKYLKVPIQDHARPTLAQITRSVEFISSQLSHGNPVLVHCLGGMGRTGTILACYFTKNLLVDAESAIKETRRIRPGSIEKSQEASITDYFIVKEKNRRDT